MSEFWERKMKTYFNYFDFDDNGVITKEDFDMLAIRFAEVQNADAERKEKLLKDCRAAWTIFTSAAEGDAKQNLQLPAFIESLRIQIQDPEAMKESFGAVLRTMFDMIDVNNDGYLQEDEHRKVFEAVGVPDSSFSKEAFAAIDVNHDGKLSFDEFIDGFFEFLLSQDENNPNNLFFGPLVS